jgi:hypothetical protein
LALSSIHDREIKLKKAKKGQRRRRGFDSRQMVEARVSAGSQRSTDRESQAYSHLAATDPNFKIFYLVPHQVQDLADASPFGWYTPGLHAAAAPLISAATLPADVREPYTDLRSLLLHRLGRRIWPQIIPIELDALSASANHFRTPFRVFISNDAVVADAIDEFLATEPWPVLHVSSIAKEGRVIDVDLNVERLLNYCETVLDRLVDDPGFAAIARMVRRELPHAKRRKVMAHSLPNRLHNVTKPNEAALEALGWTLNREDPISAPLTPGENDPQRYVDRICQSADAVYTERDKLVGRLRPDLIDYRYIIAVQSVYWGHFADWRARTSQIRGKDAKLLRSAYAMAVQSTSYFDTLKERLSPAHLFIAETRAADARSFTAGLTVLAAASFAPVLRLEPKLNQVRGDLKLFAACVRTRAKHHFDWKQSRMARNIGQKMRALVNPEFLARIDRPEKGLIEGLKLVTDLPLELMHSGDLPISLRFDVSRVPVVPGNLFLALAVTPPIFLPLAAFKEVLVVRSFSANDPLRRILEVSIAAALPAASKSNVNTRFVDVSNEDEFVAAVNTFKGAIMIFDGHGTFDDDLGSGMIVIGGKNVNAWELRRRCTVPPIVILSACDTQPLDGSHSSAATAAFVLGAHTVLGTMLPIVGAHAAMFIGRLLYRLSEYMPLAIKYRPVFTWREVVSGMSRMTHITEVVATLRQHAGRAYEHLDWSGIQLIANTVINQRRADWYDVVLRAIARVTGQSVDIVREDIQRWASMTDSMKYVQLGHPESVVVVEEDARELFEAKARRVTSPQS